MTAPFSAARLDRPLWPHQRRALAAFEADRRAGDSATYLVVPPGGGKTLIGLEAARRLGRPTVVLCPNTAIQAQWARQWETCFTGVTESASTSRDLVGAMTVLTYQAVCTLSPGGDGGRTADVMSLLHPNGRELIERMGTGGPWTLVLDECHHLLELWGRLLRRHAVPAMAAGPGGTAARSARRDAVVAAVRARRAGARRRCRAAARSRAAPGYR